MRIFFYGLFDPLFPGLYRYVGQTHRLVARKAQHRMCYSARGATYGWQMLLRHARRKPLLDVLTTLDIEFDYCDVRYHTHCISRDDKRAVLDIEKRLAFEIAERQGGLLNAAVMHAMVGGDLYREYSSALRKMVTRRNPERIEAVLEIESRLPPACRVCELGRLHLWGNYEEIKPRSRRPRKAAACRS